MTEKQALKELRNGSEDALNWFIHQYTPYVTTVIHNIIGSYMDTADVEEVASDVFFTLWENAQNIHSVKGFLGTVARNKAKNKLRELNVHLPLEDHILVVDTEDIEEIADRKALAIAVKRAGPGYLSSVLLLLPKHRGYHPGDGHKSVHSQEQATPWPRQTEANSDPLLNL